MPVLSIHTASARDWSFLNIFIKKIFPEVVLSDGTPYEDNALSIDILRRSVALTPRG
jgi:hypothetical protein